MPHRSLRICAVAGSLPSGECATALARDAIDPTEYRASSDYVGDLAAAWQDGHGNVTVGVTDNAGTRQFPAGKHAL